MLERFENIKIGSLFKIGTSNFIYRKLIIGMDKFNFVYNCEIINAENREIGFIKNYFSVLVLDDSTKL